MRKLIKTVILGISLTILAFPLNATRSSFNGDPYPKTIILNLDKVNEDKLKAELRKIGPKLEILNIYSDELQKLDLSNLEYLQEITIDCPYLTNINISNCRYLEEISFSGFTPWPQNININNCPWLQCLDLSDSDINDQQLKKLLFFVRDTLILLYLSSCKNLQDIDLKVYPKLKLLSLTDCPGLQQNIQKLRATGVEIEIIH